MDTWILLLGVGALALAAVLYFVVLPHAEGPSLADQIPDHKAWLVQCPNCQSWQTLEPFSSEEGDLSKQEETEFVNWYRCRKCEHRWEERYRR